MILARFHALTRRYPSLRVAVVGDFCLDRYLEIDPAKRELSLETGLLVHNVVNVRAQPGGAGTVLNNLVALGIGKVLAIGFCGEDAEGYELRKAMSKLRGASLKHFFATAERRTFTYTKPIVLRRGHAPRELNRLDFKNWTPTPAMIRQKLTRAVRAAAVQVDAMIALDQTDVPGTGVVSSDVLETIRAVAKRLPRLLILADSRRGLNEFPPIAWKLNAAELAAHVGARRRLSLAQMKTFARELAQKNWQPVFVTLAERGILAASPDGEVAHVPALQLRGKIDIVGAGDAVTANLAAALAAGATLREALEIANGAAAIVIHELGTTGTASVREIEKALTPRRQGAKARRTRFGR
jgi:rfaE bifunctional protein kinase chain/domain